MLPAPAVTWSVAVMVTVPVVVPAVKSPLSGEPGVPALVAMLMLDVVQVAEEVRSHVVPSAYVPIAVNCTVAVGTLAILILVSAGVTVMDAKGALFTVRRVELEIFDITSIAVMNVEPGVGVPAVTRPLPIVPGVLATVAIPVSDELHVRYNDRS